MRHRDRPALQNAFERNSYDESTPPPPPGPATAPSMFAEVVHLWQRWFDNSTSRIVLMMDLYSIILSHHEVRYIPLFRVRT